MDAEAVEKNRVGRPSMDAEEKRGVSAAMYLTPAEHVAFMAIVTQSGMSMSNYIRKACGIDDGEEVSDVKEEK